MIVKFETAKRAKEVGFDILCDYGYNPNYETLIEPISAWHYLCKLDDKKSGIQAPTQSELQRWLREEHNIQMIMQPYYNSYGIPKVTFICDAICMDDNDKLMTVRFIVNGVDFVITLPKMFTENVKRYNNYNILGLPDKLELIRDMINSIQSSYRWDKKGKRNPNYEINPYYIFYQKIKDLDLIKYAKTYNGYTYQLVKKIDSKTILLDGQAYIKTEFNVTI